MTQNAATAAASTDWTLVLLGLAKTFAFPLSAVLIVAVIFLIQRYVARLTARKTSPGFTVASPSSDFTRTYRTYEMAMRRAEQLTEDTGVQFSVLHH